MKSLTLMSKLLGLFISLLFLSNATADDLEIYGSNMSGRNKPNILFIIDKSGSMGRQTNGKPVSNSNQISKMDILKTVFNEVLESSTGKINAGYLDFNDVTSGVKWPVIDLETDATTLDSNITAGYTSKDVLKSILEYTVPNTSTNYVSPLIEARRYFRGEDIWVNAYSTVQPVTPPTWIDDRYQPETSNAPSPSTYSPQNAFLNGNFGQPSYISPISNSCQANYIIFLSDGLPTMNPNQSVAEEILGSTCETLGTAFYNDFDGDCAAELIENMATTDQIAAIPGSVVKTFTIGFGLTGADAAMGNNLLQTLADRGQGEYYSADSYDSLISSFNSVIDSIATEVDDFSGFSVGVRNSSFSNDNRAFVNLFKPNSSRSWPGNMKGYFIGTNGLTDINGNAVLDDEGNFKETAQSFWSANYDGSTITSGGINETIATGSRNLYTYTGSVPPSDVNLRADTNALSSSNENLTNTMLGVSSQTDREELLDWVATTNISDPLHSKPVIAKYTSGEVVFTMTNQGFIHAIDAATPIDVNDESGGAELYAFIPQELLANLALIKTNLNTGSHIYGLDGQITLHHEDDDNDGIIDSNEVARLYIGMRRGGNNYYALDISNKTSPRLLWQIKGGEGDYAAMGQSWSRLALTTLKSGNDKKVLIFGGGYDLAEDSKTTRSIGTGNRVFITEAATGELLWSAGSGASGMSVPGMVYSIPSDLTIVDLNGNGYTDHIYFGDMGGQVWRIKFEETLGSDGTPSNNFTNGASVTKIGDFGASANRKFFYPPAIALMSQSGESYLAVTIGSGNRANPLNVTVQDMIFMIRDPINTPLTTTARLNDLYDATENSVSEGTDQADERDLLNDANGWYIKLNTGEKSLSKVVIYDEKLRFTTYEPAADDADADADSCAISSSTLSRYYVMNLGDATPSSDSLVDESTLTADDRFVEVDAQGIASEPSIIFPADGNTVEVFIGKENISTVHQGVKQLYWKQVH